MIHLKINPNAILNQIQHIRKTYIKGTIERNAKPILITPVARLKYKNEQFITDLTEYCIAMKEVAQEESIPLIDLNTKSLHYYSSLGYEEAMKLFMVSVKGSDYTHFTELGGVEIARLVAEGIKELNIDLSRYIK